MSSRKISLIRSGENSTSDEYFFQGGLPASAQIYSLVETAKVNGQEPYTWLRHVLERLPHAQSVEDFEALLPWNCSPEIPR